MMEVTGVSYNAFQSTRVRHGFIEAVADTLGVHDNVVRPPSTHDAPSLLATRVKHTVPG